MVSEDIRDFKIRRLRTTNHGWTSIKKNEQIPPYLGKQLRPVKLVNKVLVTQFYFFAHEYVKY